MKRNRILYLALWAVVSCMFVSCMDDKYDLDDVDLTLGTSSDLTLPSSSTGEILLKNIMDLEEDGVVQSVDGEYYLVEDGNADVPSVTIDPISIQRPVLNEISTDIEVDEFTSGARTANAAGGRFIQIVPGVEIDATPYRYTIKPEDEAHYDINESSGLIAKEVVSLESVRFVDNTTLDATIKIVFDKEHKFINKVHLDNLKLSIPKGLHVAHAEFVHWTDINATERETVSAVKTDNENGVIYLTETDESTIVDEDHVIDIFITFDRAVVGNEGFTFENNEVLLKGQFDIDGTFRLEPTDFNLDELTYEQKQAVIRDRNFDAIRPKHITFTGNAEFDNDILVNSFAGVVKTEVGDIAPIELNDMPDFLNEPDVCLDLQNPAFFVKVKNTMPSDAKTSIVLRSVYEDGTETVEIRTEELNIPKEKEVVFCLACDPDNAVVPKAAKDGEIDYTQYEKIGVKVENLGDLLKKLPKEIQVEVADVTIDTDNMPTPTAAPETYDFGVDYKVYTPLEFADEFKLVYQGTEEGIGEDLTDVDKLDTKAMRIDATAITNFPLNLTLSVDALDCYDNSLKRDVIDVDDIVISAHKGEEGYSEQPITLTISPKQGHSISELLQRLDKFQYRAVAEADGYGKLKEDSYLKLANIKITLVGGVSYDAN
ncbi:MAG: hypothetical protein IKL71_07240 [Bacteroidaceae bacterium]|nr:hypothetical protein [Bacteroidaceae bacterium]